MAMTELNRLPEAAAPDIRRTSPAADRPAVARGKVRFGSATVSVRAPSKLEIKHNVDLSTAALERAKGRLVRGGVRLWHRKNVPIFYIDATRPDLIARKLNGKVEYGTLEDGLFKVTD